MGQFNRALFNEFDSRDKSLAATWFSNLMPEFTVTIPKDPYAADLLLVDKDGIAHYAVEVETKRKFIGSKYKYPDVRYRTRKLALYDKHPGLPLIFLTINAEGTHGMFTDADLRTLPAIPVDTYRSEYLGEPIEDFVIVPVELCIPVDLFHFSQK